jgi:hypothetical protein
MRGVGAGERQARPIKLGSDNHVAHPQREISIGSKSAARLGNHARYEVKQRLIGML